MVIRVKPLLVIDALGTTVSLLSTFFYTRQSRLAWPAGLVATMINGYLFWRKGIYGDLTIELLYTCTMAYGWYLWSQSNATTTSGNFIQLTWKQWMFLTAASLFLYSLIWFLLTSFTHSTVAKLDALTTTLSLLAQLLMCYKIIATWVVWLIVDGLYVMLYSTKQLPFHVALMLIYLAMAVWGLHYWKNIDQK
jgi:nicotinamide mononucleotide transporter